MSESRLKPRQYYIDLYDRHTVERCRRTEQSFKQNDTSLPKGKKISKKGADQIKIAAEEWYLHMETGERYLNKEKTIREWMEADQKQDHLLESAEAPEDIRCLTCRSRLKSTFKTLWFGSDDKEDRVLFMYDCPNNCLPRRSFFSDGEEWRTKPNLCPECNTPLTYKEVDEGVKAITTHTCSKCGYTKTDEYEWEHKKEKPIDKNFVTDRDRFCLTDEEGKKYQEEKWNWERLGKFAEEWKKEDEARTEKLKANPNGFHLDGSYTCAICGQNTPEGDNWYDKYGIKCLICQKAIDEGEIPASLAKNKDSWYSKFDLEHNFNLKTPTIQKWIRNGILKVRTISHYGNGVHAELFLLEDNGDFLPPKKLLEGKGVRYKKDGKDWFTTQKWYEFQDPFKHLKGYKIMDYMRVVPPEEMAAREAEEKKKWEEKQTRRETKRKGKK